MRDFIEYNIKPPQKAIPKDGNNGEQGTLNGLGLSGSIFRSIRTATHTIINDVKVPKLHNCAATSKSNVIVPIIQTTPTKRVSTCGVLYFGCNFWNTLGKKLSRLIAYKILVDANCKTSKTEVKPVNEPIDINPAF